ncbi:DNA recombination protein RmuC [Alteromonas halophila]|uniref:DNA recombination protein RmuC n=1 Tax=Alteromonas halophila TaxID=516698 RepID=A0A918JLR5_9ALTE|nr:DNA recombination protein RmuC [Alteromonas halophila]GGW88402.1 DNA recombination protein RmuC [Alteromonas halophila]
MAFLSSLSPLHYVLALAILLSGVAAGFVTASRRKQREVDEAREQAEQLELTSRLASERYQQQLAQREQDLRDTQQELRDTHQSQLALQEQLGSLNQKAEQLVSVQDEYRRLQSEFRELQESHSALRARYESQSTSLDDLKAAHEEKVALLENTEQRLQTQFENLANKIFDAKSESYQKQNKQGLDAILNPLKEQIDGFRKQVSDQYVKEGQERASLKTEISSLKELNQKITEEANALTLALKGSSKTQGNWGEVVLERILKESGLREGHEFETQVSARNEDGKLQQPDVVVHLPDDKDVVIDAKVSLAAYEKYFNSEDPGVRERCLSEHVASIRNHIKGLGSKDYHELKALRSLDYVLMFIPIESAFLLAIDEDPELVNLALANNIMLVSPTNLLVALRTIHNIWQYEYQNQNAQKIANNAAKLYDKFVGFVADMEKIGKSIEGVQKNYDGAINKLSQGRGNLVRQVEQFRELGVQPSKRLPDELASQALDTQDDTQT